MFIDNKYTKWYFDIIQQASSQTRNKRDGYFERHHIIPRSLGGTNAKFNLVLLTGREHYVVHQLLVRMVSKTNTYKMVHAIVRFSHKVRNSREFEMIRKTASRFSSGELNPSYGKRWHYNKNTNHIVLIDPNLASPELIMGLPIQLGGRTTDHKWMWIHTNDEETMIPSHESVPPGWNVGRLSTRPTQHMKKMAAKRHTPQKDAQHATKLRGRVSMKHVIDKNRVMVHPDDISSKELDGYVVYGACSIAGIRYLSVIQAARDLNMVPATIKNRLKSVSDLWLDWKYVYPELLN